MIFRTKTVEGAPEDVELGIEIFRAAAAPSCRETDGFIRGWFLVDRDSGTTITLTVWRDEAGIAEARRRLRERIVADAQLARMLARVNSAPVRFENWEVAAEAVPPPHDAG